MLLSPELRIIYERDQNYPSTHGYKTTSFTLFEDKPIDDIYRAYSVAPTALQVSINPDYSIRMTNNDRTVTFYIRSLFDNHLYVIDDHPLNYVCLTIGPCRYISASPTITYASPPYVDPKVPHFGA